MGADFVITGLMFALFLFGSGMSFGIIVGCAIERKKPDDSDDARGIGA